MGLPGRLPLSLFLPHFTSWHFLQEFPLPLHIFFAKNHGFENMCYDLMLLSFVLMFTLLQAEQLLSPLDSVARA